MNLNELTPILKVRMQNWIEVIRQYQSNGLINKEWCTQNGVSEKNYYYHLAKIRKLALVEIPHKAQIKTIETTYVQEESPFAKVIVVGEQPVIQAPIVVHKGSAAVEINQEIDASLLRIILEAL